MQVLSVINEMLGTMGEKPLASLEEPHEFKGAGLAKLDEATRQCQARGWWFNMENITLNPMLNGRISLSGDTINIRTQDNTVTQRGRYLYDLKNGTDIFTSSVDVVLVRLIKFEDLPESVAAYVAAKAILDFQILYDGDQVKAGMLAQQIRDTWAHVQTEDVRNKRANLILANPNLMRLKMLTNQARRYIRS